MPKVLECSAGARNHSRRSCRVWIGGQLFFQTCPWKEFQILSLCTSDFNMLCHISVCFDRNHFSLTVSRSLSQKYRTPVLVAQNVKQICIQTCKHVRYFSYFSIGKISIIPDSLAQNRTSGNPTNRRQIFRAAAPAVVWPRRTPRGSCFHPSWSVRPTDRCSVKVWTFAPEENMCFIDHK